MISQGKIICKVFFNSAEKRNASRVKNIRVIIPLGTRQLLTISLATT